jgi:microsomal dipeptidase-like Zn-dependent dipeptidase
LSHRELSSSFTRHLDKFPTYPGRAKNGESQHSLLLSTIQQIDLLHSIFERYSSNFTFASHSSEIIPAFRTGRVVSLLGIEGLHQIGGSPSVLRMLFRLGVRYATLCHNKGNEFVDSAVSNTLLDRFLPLQLMHNLTRRRQRYMGVYQILV